MELSKLHDICQKHTGSNKQYYAHPIPERKVAGARESLNIPNSEQIVALIDFTTSGSAKDALVVAETGLYWILLGKSAVSLSWDQLQQCSLCETKSSFLFSKSIKFSNGLKIALTGESAEESNHTVFKLLSELKAMLVEAVPAEAVTIEAVHVEAVSDAQTDVNSGHMDSGFVECEFCKGRIKPEVTFCKHCGIKLKG